MTFCAHLPPSDWRPNPYSGSRPRLLRRFALRLQAVFTFRVKWGLYGGLNFEYFDTYEIAEVLRDGSQH